MANEYLRIDMRELTQLVNHMHHIHTEENFQKLMYRALARTGTHVRTQLGKILPLDYEVNATWVRSQVGKPRTTFTGGTAGVQCIIPLEGKRGILGDRFKAGVRSGNAGQGLRGKLMVRKGTKGNYRYERRKQYSINAKLVQGQISQLPDKMRNQGGNPPFFIFSSVRRIPIVFTRRTKRRKPIVRVVGLNVPRMPLNRSREEVQKETIEMLEKRILHEHDVIMRGLVK